MTLQAIVATYIRKHAYTIQTHMTTASDRVYARLQ